MDDLKFLYEELKKNYKIITENSMECIWVLDLNSLKFIYISPSVEKFREADMNILQNQSIEDWFTKESYKRFKNLVIKKAEKYFVEGDNGKNSNNKYEFEELNSKGEIINIELDTKFIFNPSTKSINIVGVSHNITKFKKNELKKNIEIEENKKEIKRLLKYEKELSKVMITLTKQNEMLKNMAIKDELTGVFNRHYFDEIIPIAMERNDRYHEPLSMILFDIDHFKKVNDTWGHPVGDEVLIKISKTVKNNIRKPDTLIRWGGEEFTILLPQTTVGGAAIVAEKLRVLLENIIHPHAGKVTSSFAVAERYLGESFELWFERLDNALYEAKKAGRNRVTTVDNTYFIPLPYTKIKWKKTWNSGNYILDRQKRYVIELANSLVDSAVVETFSAETEKKLNSLTNHLNYHFFYEEKILAEVKYPYIEEQKIYHNQIRKKMDLIKSSFFDSQVKAADLFEFFLEDIVFNHFLKEDLGYFKYLEK